MAIQKPTASVVDGEIVAGKTALVRVQQENTGDASDNTWHAIVGNVDGGVPFGYLGSAVGTAEVRAPVTIPADYTGRVGVEVSHVNSQQQAIQGFMDDTPPEDNFRAVIGQVQGSDIMGFSRDTAVGAAGGLATGVIGTLALQSVLGMDGGVGGAVPVSRSSGSGRRSR